MLRIRWISIFAFSLLCIFTYGCSGSREAYDRDIALRRVLEVQRLQNLQPEDSSVVDQMEAIIDSMRRAGKDVYYFGAINVLIDRLFSDGRYVEADSLAVSMLQNAKGINDSLSMAMAKRVRAQIFYKLFQPERAQQELLEALPLASDPLKSAPHFSTAASINEWLHIVSMANSDSTVMKEAGNRYADITERVFSQRNVSDTTGHYRVTALAFLAENAILANSPGNAAELLDSATLMIKSNLPARAYEHFYRTRSGLRAASGDYSGALDDIDTLLSTHKNFPWFYLKDLLLKANVQNAAGMHKESSETYSDYIAFHDSLSSALTDRRLHDLTSLYRTELSKEEQRSHTTRLLALGSVTLLLIILLGVTLRHAVLERKRNRLLVERLHEYDRAEQTLLDKITDPISSGDKMSLIARLDCIMLTQKPYTNPALGRKELADEIGISQDALAQIIRAEYDMTVHAYINSFRTEELRRLLDDNTHETITELASRLGFGTTRTLQRAFKERFDMTPTQYKEASASLRTPNNQ